MVVPIYNIPCCIFVCPQEIHPSMAYNEELVSRLREYFDGMKNVEEKKMFGGVCFMLNEKMCVGVSKDHLMVRFDPELQDSVMTRKWTEPMQFTNRTMKGYVFVAPAGVKNKRDLDCWIELAIDYNARAKSSKKAKPARSKKK